MNVTLYIKDGRRVEIENVYCIRDFSRTITHSLYIQIKDDGTICEGAEYDADMISVVKIKLEVDDEHKKR